MRIVAVVPVKKFSERVESKNFRDFVDGHSLFSLLINKLIDTPEIDEIYVSSNAENIQEEVEKLGCKFIYRDDNYCNNEVSWSDVIAHVASSLPEKDNTSVAWCHTTSPLFDEYSEAIQSYKKSLSDGNFDGLVTVSELSDFVISEKLQPLNYSWGPWHKYSQHLESFFCITGALFITSKEQMIQNRYVISKNPKLFNVSKFKSIDIDDEYDFKLAQLLFKNKNFFKK